ncbi:LysR family transcriptional regulator [Streptomyces sp. NPDC056835]|uniref:LysR family transcriptional regulator n=1 Tax=Streptomyces sp. NPDC056835 TaxID=3345956 RepID=UPI00367401B6
MDLRTLRYFVAVAEELHFGRAAARLHMTQPPLSRAIQQLETELGCTLLHRSHTGVALTTAGTALHEEARTLLAQAEQVRTRVTAVAGAATLTVGTLADSAEQVGTRLAAAYRHQHPTTRVRIREADLTDPTAGLRTGLVDVALTRAPFDDTGITVRVLRSDPVGVVLRADDPLAGHESLRLDDLADRRWFQLPEGTDPAWRAYWSGPPVRRGAARRPSRADRTRMPSVHPVGRERGPDIAHPRPSRRPHLRPLDRQAIQRPRHRLEHHRHRPAHPLLRADRRGRLPPVLTWPTATADPGG